VSSWWDGDFCWSGLVGRPRSGSSPWKEELHLPPSRRWLNFAEQIRLNFAERYSFGGPPHLNAAIGRRIARQVPTKRPCFYRQNVSY
jgi:hypothetical protein